MEEIAHSSAQQLGICGEMGDWGMELIPQALPTLRYLGVGTWGLEILATLEFGDHLQFHPKVEEMFLTKVVILVMGVMIVYMVWLEAMEEMLQQAGLLHHHILHLMVAMMGLLLIFTVVVWDIVIPLGALQILSEMDLVQLVMDSVLHRRICHLKVQLVMLAVMVLVKDRQTEGLVARRILPNKGVTLGEKFGVESES